MKYKEQSGEVVGQIMKVYIFALILCSCVSKRVANYKVTDHGIIAYKYTKGYEPKKDILSSGDTLISTLDTVYIRHKK